MKILILLVALVTCTSCKSTIEVSVKRTSGSVENHILKARKKICVVTFIGDSIPKLVDYRYKVLLDSTEDFEVLRISKH